MPSDVLLLQLPSPPGRNVFREWAGGMGTALPSQRTEPGHDQKFYDIPFSAFLYIARVLELDGVDYAYRDGQAAERFDGAGLLAELRARPPKVVVSVINIPSYDADLAWLAEIRAAAPGVRVILLGPTAKWYKDRLLRQGHADLVMEEGEELLTARNAAALAAGQGLDAMQGGSVLGADGAVRQKPALTPMRDLNFVDFPAYHLLDFNRYTSDFYASSKRRYATVFSTKGCPYRCGYCPYPFGFGKHLLYRDPERVGDDIARLVRDHGVGQILFRDQVFTINRKHAVAVCQAIIDRKLDIEWLCETRYDVVDEELLDLMKRAGCREVHFGLESADPEMFGSVAKSDGPQSLELFAKAIAWTKARGLRCHTHLIVGMPDESWTSVRNTAKWLRQAKPDSVQLAYYVPYPGTPMYHEIKQQGVLPDPDSLNLQDMGSFTGAVMPTRHLRRDEVERAYRRLQVDSRYTLVERVLNRLRRLVVPSTA